METEFRQIKRFVEDYKHFDHTMAKSRIAHDKARFSGVLTGYKAVKSVIDLYEKRMTTDYNVFTLYKNAWKDETRTHSPFLKDLLDIRGSHKQGDLFYLEFLKQLGLPSITKYATTNSELFNIGLEKWCGDGKIDILISYHDNNKKFAIAIENKIFAADQHRQLERYHNYLHRHYGENFLLIYLTINGQQPVEKVINNIPLETYHNSGSFRIVSYQTNIVKMLQNTIPQIESGKVKFIVEQYLLTLKIFE